MKSYQEWNDEQCATHCPEIKSDICGACAGVGDREDVWRAAYESIRKEINSNSKRWHPVGSILDFIDEELDE